MRQIKASSNYLKTQVWNYFAKAALSLIIFVAFVVIFFGAFSKMPTDLQLVGVFFWVAPLVAFYFFMRKYNTYRGGWVGEKQVTKLLGNKLSDDYYLISNLYFHDGGGDIDQIVLGPNGIFVLETKNWKGTISCNIDDWQRVGKHNFNSSPSRQVKRNVAKIKQRMTNSAVLRNANLWVEGIVVFTNNHAALILKNPTVTVLKLHQLPNHIITHPSSRIYSRKELENIATELINQRR